MAVGLDKPGKLLPIKGINIATTAAGNRNANRDNLVLVNIDDGATCSGLFTQNRFCAAPVVIAKHNLHVANPRALIINAGNANAGTGAEGLRNATLSCQAVADKLGILPSQVLPFSTGVIGVQLDLEVMVNGIEELTSKQQENNWLSAANAIMTTDTVAKGLSEKIEIDGSTITITGIAKGSGMICPDMATLLSFVATDAAIDNRTLDAMLKQAAAASFNRITVDSDTSTNDALILIATAKSNLNTISSLDQPQAKLFITALQRVLVGLATAVIRDAEGATKFIKIDVCSGNTIDDCKAIAYSVAHSPLVKTALFASDPNWGRLLMAIGKSKIEELDVSKIKISINGIQFVENGEPAISYTEAAGQSVFEQAEIEIDIDLGIGSENYHVWTSDLSHDYVSINADYRS